MRGSVGEPAPLCLSCFGEWTEAVLRRERNPDHKGQMATIQVNALLHICSAIHGRQAVNQDAVRLAEYGRRWGIPMAELKNQTARS
jgi:hypothetical protein